MALRWEYWALWSRHVHRHTRFSQRDQRARRAWLRRYYEWGKLWRVRPVRLDRWLALQRKTLPARLTSPDLERLLAGQGKWFIARLATVLARHPDLLEALPGRGGPSPARARLHGLACLYACQREVDSVNPQKLPRLILGRDLPPEAREAGMEERNAFLTRHLKLFARLLAYLVKEHWGEQTCLVGHPDDSPFVDTLLASLEKLVQLCPGRDRTATFAPFRLTEYWGFIGAARPEGHRRYARGLAELQRRLSWSLHEESTGEAPAAGPEAWPRTLLSPQLRRDLGLGSDHSK